MSDNFDKTIGSVTWEACYKCKHGLEVDGGCDLAAVDDLIHVDTESEAVICDGWEEK